MPTDWKDISVRCPFFLESGSRTIRCEGVLPGSWNTTTFTGAAERKKQMEQLCQAAYCRCGLYRQIEAKYE